MKTFIILLIILIIIFISYNKRLTYNPYDLTMIIGKKGSGKTTLLSKIAIKYIKKGWIVISNVEIFGTYKLDIESFGSVEYPKNSIILIDEVGLIWDNRNYKAFKKEVNQYFKLQRHYKSKIVLCSQVEDYDIKIRNLTDKIYLCENYFGFLSIARKIIKMNQLYNGTDLDSNKESFLGFSYKYGSIFDIMITYIPRYVQFFNSYDAPKLPRFKLIPYHYENYSELYKLTRTKYYIKQCLNTLITTIKKNYINNKKSINIKKKDIIRQKRGTRTKYFK